MVKMFIIATLCTLKITTAPGVHEDGERGKNAIKT